jgi:hypothetical protein
MAREQAFISGTPNCHEVRSNVPVRSVLAGRPSDPTRKVKNVVKKTGHLLKALTGG